MFFLLAASKPPVLGCPAGVIGPEYRIFILGMVLSGERLSQSVDDVIGILVHTAECNDFLSKVFYRAADEVYRVVGNEESVVHIDTAFHLDG